MSWEGMLLTQPHIVRKRMQPRFLNSDWPEINGQIEIYFFFSFQRIVKFQWNSNAATGTKLDKNNGDWRITRNAVGLGFRSFFVSFCVHYTALRFSPGCCSCPPVAIWWTFRVEQNLISGIFYLQAIYFFGATIREFVHEKMVFSRLWQRKWFFHACRSESGFFTLVAAKIVFSWLIQIRFWLLVAVF